jgi:hypothetical protein
VLLSGLEFVYSFEYWAVIVCMGVVHMQVVSGLTGLVHFSLDCLSVFPFILTYMTSTVFIVPCVCLEFNVWFEYTELILLFHIGWICLLNSVLNVRPVRYILMGHFCCIYQFVV